MNKENTNNNTSNYINALPYLSVLPITEKCLDFSVVDNAKKGLAKEILQQLSNKDTALETTISLAFNKKTAASQINALKALQKTFEDFKQQKHSLSLGYPIVLIEDEKLGRPVAAPLFLWKVTLANAEKEKKDWQLSPMQEDKGHLNPILKNYLEARFDLDWEASIGLVDEVDADVILENCQKLADKLLLTYNNDTLLEQCPQNELPINSIINAMILGSFEPITLKEAKKLPKNLKPRERKQWKTRVPALASNSAQDQLIGTIFSGHHVVTEGPSNTGKTHVIASLLPSLLADKGAALIVSPQPASFNDIQHHLEQLGIKNIGILPLQDEVLDKERLIKYLESLPKRVRALSNFDNTVYSKQLHQYMRLRHELEEAYESIHTTTIHGWNWTELVGQCLLYHQKSDKQVLNRFLDRQYFDFSEPEHELICGELTEHYTHYTKIDALKHPLNALHGRFFDENSTLNFSDDQAKDGINVFKHKTTYLYQKYLAFVGNYAEHLKFEYRDFAASMEQQIDKIERDLHLYNDLYGDAFDKQSSFQNAKLKVLSMFSRKHQEIRAAKAQLLDDYERLKKCYDQANFFQTNFPAIEEETKLADIEAKLEKVRTELLHWTKEIPTLVEQKTKELSGDAPYNQYFEDAFKDLEQAATTLIEQLNQAQLLKRLVALPEGNINEREAFLLKLLLQFQKLENEWRDFNAYYHWRRSWLSISQKTQKVVQALVNTGSNDWLSSYNSWFYHQILTQQYSIDLPCETTKTPLPFKAYIETLAKVQQLISKKADLITKERQNEQIKRIKKEKDLTLTNARPIFTNKKIKDLLQWIGLEHLGEVFPIILATPQMAQQLLGLKIATFDVIMIDNAQDLPSKLGIDLLKLGNQRIVFGRPQDDQALSTPDNLMEWMLEQKGRQYQRLESTHSKDAGAIERLNKSTVLEPHAFQRALHHYLGQYIAVDRLHFNKSVEGVIVDLVIDAIHPNQPSIAIICDGDLLKQAKYDFQLAVDKERILRNENYIPQYAWSVYWWKNSDLALQPLLAYIIEWDQQYEK